MVNWNHCYNAIILVADASDWGLSELVCIFAVGYVYRRGNDIYRHGYPILVNVTQFNIKLEERDRVAVIPRIFGID